MNLRKRNKVVVSKSSWLIFLSFILCIAAIGYAILSRQIKINGTANVPKITWNVQFNNIRVFGDSVAASVPTINNKTSIQLSETKLNQPNDYYKFLVDVENTGTLDAKIISINLPEVSDKLEFKVTYKDGTALNINDILKAKEKKTLLVVLKYKDITSAEEIAANVEFTVEYSTADSSAHEPTIEYTVNDFINIANGPLTTSYASNSIKSEMYAFVHSKTEQVKKNIDYRYIGNVPDNYIKFNNETWRIIGIFQTNDGKNRLKIIKDTSVASMSWDYKQNGVGSSTSDNGSNDWSDSQLMYFLNPDDIGTNATAKGYTYASNLVKSGSTVIYEKDKIPAAVASGATTYGGAVNNWHISTDALTKVDSVTYYLGGTAWNDTTHWGSTVDIYNSERGTTTSNNSRPTNWTGKVALMYPSDYGYTFAKGIDDICYNDLSSCNNGTPSNSWLFKSANQWTLVSRSDSARGVLYVGSGGIVGGSSAYNGYGVRPVVYLKSDIKLTGLGTVDKPYTIIE